ncbi:33436_t:CDS:1, partial [Gigaspora margarita]
KINEDKASVPMYQIKKTESNELPQLLLFQHLARFKQTPNIVQSHSPKQKYRFGMGYAKKALDLAIRANKVDDFVNEIERFIEKTKRDMSDQDESVNPTNVEVVSIGDPLRVQHKGQQSKRYKSGGELLKKSTRNKKEGRHCQKCGQTGHYAP